MCARCKSGEITVGVELHMGNERIHCSVKFKKSIILRDGRDGQIRWAALLTSLLHVLVIILLALPSPKFCTAKY
jgi:hypothetical protein